MKLLAVETSTDACSVALGVDQEIRERHEIAPRQHGKLLLPFIDELMAEAGLDAAQLDGFVLGRGPGSFTGVRIGAGVVQGMAFATGLPVALVSSLAILAQGTDDRFVLCVQDARMGEVYAGAFKRVEGHAEGRAEGQAEGMARAMGAEQVCAPEAVTLPENFRGTAVGRGVESYGGILKQTFGEMLRLTGGGQGYPRACDALGLGGAILQAGGGVEAALALPVYLRDRVAHRGGGQ